MNAPFPTNPSFGQYFGNWVWSGSRWVCATTGVGTRVNQQVFAASAPYTPSPGLVSLEVECMGAGGGGGGAAGAATDAIAGGGGGSGGYSRVTLAAALVLGGVNVTIGQGGAGGLATDPAGAPGQATSFGALCVANGGAGGGSGGIGGGQGGAGASVGVGPVAFNGNCGQSGMFFQGPILVWAHAGSGGAMWGGNSPALDTGTGTALPGGPGVGNTGAGGTGGAANGIAQNVGGGAGANGVCIVTEYLLADAGDTGCGCGPTGGAARVAIGSGPQSWGYDND